jgi:hypothetical protein
MEQSPRHPATALVTSHFDHLVGVGGIDRAIVRASALAVLRLISSSNLVDCCTRRSAGSHREDPAETVPRAGDTCLG